MWKPGLRERGEERLAMGVFLGGGGISEERVLGWFGSGLRVFVGEGGGG